MPFSSLTLRNVNGRVGYNNMAKSKSRSSTKKSAKPRATARGNAKNAKPKRGTKAAPKHPSEVLRVGADGHRDTLRLLKYVQKNGWNGVASRGFSHAARPTLGLVAHQAVRTIFAQVSGKDGDDDASASAPPVAEAGIDIVPEAGPTAAGDLVPSDLGTCTCTHDAAVHVYPDAEATVAPCHAPACECQGYNVPDAGDDVTVDGNGEGHTEDASDDPTAHMDGVDADAGETVPTEAMLASLDERSDARLDPAAPMFTLGNLSVSSGR